MDKMKIRILLYIIGSLILFSCGEKNGQETSFDDLQINKSDQFLALPAGVIENKVTTYEEGFTQHFIYKENSYVIILQGGNAELAVPNNSKSDKFPGKKELTDFNWCMEM